MEGDRESESTWIFHQGHLPSWIGTAQAKGSAVKILERAEAPAHLFNISELDFSENLFAERLSLPWVRLGVMGPSHTNESGVEEELRINTLLLEPGAFADAFGGLGAVGNNLWAVGQPGVVSSGDETKYEPFYDFTIA